MLYDRILVRYGDLTLKGRNKRDFINRVVHLTRLKLQNLNVKVEYTHDRMYILLNDTNHEEVIRKLGYVSGILSYSLVLKCLSDIEDIKEKADLLIHELVKEEVTFKVETKRADKNFPNTSQEITKIVASSVLKNNKYLHVDVHNPNLILHVEVRKEASYLYTKEIKGLGGFPVGVAGKGLVMISGGIDSPVAAFLAQKQGIEIEMIHFESTPLTSIESAQKVIDLTKKLACFSPKNKIIIHMVPFMELHQELLKNIPDSYQITIMRRMMYKIADEIARKNNILVLINGESVGQVASQTLESMHVINAVTALPVLRPLATYDKNDIVQIAKKIDTYLISIKPFEDCCTVYIPKNPVTKPLLEKCQNYENKIDYTDLLKTTVENTKTIQITADSTLDITYLGIEVRKVIEKI